MPDPTTTDRVVIWSGEHRAWWRKSARGYTNNRAQAGVYSRSYGERLRASVGPEKQIELQDANNE